MTNDMTCESVTGQQLNKPYAAAVLLTVVAIAGFLPAMLVKPLWVERGMSKNDAVVGVFLPIIRVCMMVVWPIILIRERPDLAAFDRKWFRWTFSELLGFPLLVLVALFLPRAIQILVKWPRSYNHPDFLFSNDHNAAFIIVLGTMVVLVGPIVEEVFWRGYVQSTLARIIGSRTAIVVQAVLFGALHAGMVHAVHACLIGCVFGLWCYKRKTLLPVILAHVLVNATAIGIGAWH